MLLMLSTFRVLTCLVAQASLQSCTSKGVIPVWSVIQHTLALYKDHRSQLYQMQKTSVLSLEISLIFPNAFSPGKKIIPEYLISVPN